MVYLWGMKLNACNYVHRIQFHTRSRTLHPQSLALTVGGTVLKESDDRVILGVTFYFMMTVEKHFRSVSREASQRVGILRKYYQVFHDRRLFGRCFRFFVLPVLD